MELYFMHMSGMFMAGLIMINGALTILSAMDLGGMNEWLQEHFRFFREDAVPAGREERTPAGGTPIGSLMSEQQNERNTVN